ncbi:MAG: hypothetical protein OXN93_08700 [bacterium]|nr:hypothetical protein [bacterium]
MSAAPESEARIHRVAIELEAHLAEHQKEHGGNPDFFAEKLLHIGDIVDSFRPRPAITRSKEE